MKKVLFFALCIVFTASLQAQIRFGVKAGLNMAAVSTSETPGVSYSMKADFYAGALLAIPITEKLSLQPEALYSGQGSGIKADSVNGKYNFQYINVPVLIKYKIINILAVETGPQFGLLVGAKAKADGGASTDIKDQLKTSDFGWTLGLSLLLPMHFGVDARYNLGLTNFLKNSEDASGSIKNGVLQVGVFYLFGK